MHRDVWRNDPCDRPALADGWGQAGHRNTEEEKTSYLCKRRSTHAAVEQKKEASAEGFQLA